MTDNSKADLEGNVLSPATSAVGEKMKRLTGVRAIMKDIVETLHCKPGIVNLSAGNPVILPEVSYLWRRHTLAVVQDGSFDEAVGRYGSSQGYEPLIEAIVDSMNANYGSGISNENVLITPGSQMLYFMAANTFGGMSADGQMKKIVLPMCPEYTGYEGVTLDGRTLHSFAPVIRELSDHEFKYGINLDAKFATEDTGAILFSRPCNPTGNILSDAEVDAIVRQGNVAGIPVFIDSAYGPPFPNIVFDEFAKMRPAFGGNIVHCMSLSKAGMPGERIGIAIGAPEFIAPLLSFQSNASLHGSRFGQAIAARAIASGELMDISRSVIGPFYRSKLECMRTALKQELGDLPWSLHKGEGSLFAWLWMKDLPVSDAQLYGKLKENNLIVVPGSAFFPGFREDWPHMQQCVRISLTAPEEEIEKGVKILGRVLKTIYDPAPSGRHDVKSQVNSKPAKAFGA